jgi:uncharacterized protein
VLILLPPSEGKAPVPGRGRPLDLDRLGFPELTATRRQLVTALVGLSAAHPDTALAILGLSPGQAGEVALNRALMTAPARPAADLYTGVLYDSLGLSTLSLEARRRANRSLLVFSGLWGVLRPGDRVPAYRLSGNVVLPGLGSLVSVWREPLAAAMESAAGRGLVLDLRSTSYAALWRPAGPVADRTLTLRVLQERRPGDSTSRVVVSHFNKATKGRLVHALLESGAAPKKPADLLAAIGELGFTAEPSPGPARKPGRPHQLDVVVVEL